MGLQALRQRPALPKVAEVDGVMDLYGCWRREAEKVEGIVGVAMARAAEWQDRQIAQVAGSRRDHRCSLPILKKNDSFPRQMLPI